MSTHNRNVTLRRGVGIRLLLPAGITMCGWRLTVVLHQISEIRRKACVSCEPFARFQRSGDSIRTFSLSIVRSDPSLLGREPFRGEFSCGTGVSPVQRVQDTPRMEARTNAGVSSLPCGVLLTGGAPVPHQLQSPHAPIPASLDHAPQSPRQKESLAKVWGKHLRDRLELFFEGFGSQRNSAFRHSHESGNPNPKRSG